MNRRAGVGEASAPEKGHGSKRIVIIYSVLLAAVMIVFIILSSVMDRMSIARMDSLSEENTTALERIEALQASAVEMETENTDLRSRVEELEEELEKAKEEIAADEQTISEKTARIAELEREYAALLGEYNDQVDQNIQNEQEETDTGVEDND